MTNANCGLEVVSEGEGYAGDVLTQENVLSTLQRKERREQAITTNSVSLKSWDLGCYVARHVPSRDAPTEASSSWKSYIENLDRAGQVQQLFYVVHAERAEHVPSRQRGGRDYYFSKKRKLGCERSAPTWGGRWSVYKTKVRYFCWASCHALVGKEGITSS